VALIFFFILIPNHTLLVCIGSISGEFGQAIVCILARCNKANTNGETKQAGYAAEAYQKGTIMVGIYLAVPKFSQVTMIS